MVNLPTPRHARWCVNQNAEAHVCRVTLGTVGPLTLGLAQYGSTPPLLMLLSIHRVIGDMTVAEVEALAAMLERAMDLPTDDDRTDTQN